MRRYHLTNCMTSAALYTSAELDVMLIFKNGACHHSSRDDVGGPMWVVYDTGRGYRDWAAMMGRVSITFLNPEREWYPELYYDRPSV